MNTWQEAAWRCGLWEPGGWWPPTTPGGQLICVTQGPLARLAPTSTGGQPLIFPHQQLFLGALLGGRKVPVSFDGPKCPWACLGGVRLTPLFLAQFQAPHLGLSLGPFLSPSPHIWACCSSLCTLGTCLQWAWSLPSVGVSFTSNGRGPCLQWAWSPPSQEQG